MKKPIIGISGSWIWDGSGPFAMYPRAYVNHDYIRSVIEAGGLPFILPFNEDKDVCKELIASIDGLLLSGGHDIDPLRYGEEPLQGLGEVWPERDEFDTTLYTLARKRQLPIMAICRGHQVINVAQGGTLYQDSKYDKNSTIKHSQMHTPSLATHSIDIEKDSNLATLLGRTDWHVNTFHHQSVKEPGKNLKVTARAKDGVIEALEGTDYPYLMTYQFHPEMMTARYEEAQLLFKDFIKHAMKGE